MFALRTEFIGRDSPTIRAELLDADDVWQCRRLYHYVGTHLFRLIHAQPPLISDIGALRAVLKLDD